MLEIRRAALPFREEKLRLLIKTFELNKQSAEEAAMTTMKIIMDGELTIHQKITGSNQMVIPKMRYVVSCIIFGKGKFATLKERAREMDSKVRKQLAVGRLTM
ncbi:hypothetical protein Aduo_018993 [Ancylostoma duodenale]